MLQCLEKQRAGEENPKMGQVVALIPRVLVKEALVLFVTDPSQKFSLEDYIESIESVSKERRLDFTIQFCDGEVAQHVLEASIRERKYREVWCFGECTNQFALSICKTARDANISIRNYTRYCAAAYKQYEKYATHSKYGVY